MRVQSPPLPSFGDALLTRVVDEQLSVYRTLNRSRLFYLSSGANELEPPPLYGSFLRMEYDKSGLLKCYTNGTGYPPLVKVVEAYETFRAGKRVASELSDSHAGVVTFGAAGAIAGLFNCLAEDGPLNVLQIDYSYPIFERAVNQLGGRDPSGSSRQPDRTATGGVRCPSHTPIQTQCCGSQQHIEPHWAIVRRVLPRAGIPSIKGLGLLDGL